MKWIKAFIIVSIFLGCNSTQTFKVENSRFKNAEFNSVLDTMMQKLLLNQKTHSKYSATFFTTENHIYVTLMNIDCSTPPYYSFNEEVNSISLPIYIKANSIQPERFFELKDLEMTKPQDEYFYCDDFYSVIARLDVNKNKTEFKKMRTMEDEFDSDFIAKEDTIYMKTKIKIVEPEMKIREK
ncbi:MAG TPA: hypothetical protein VKY36_00780 [Moheibacter sp.]|nr:hypothetical protein [Moheibacter sp.]